MSRLRVLRVHHDGGSRAARARDRALRELGVDVTLVVPSGWPGADGPIEDVPHVALMVRRPGDVNRHSYVDERRLREVIEQVQPDLVDIHEEPVSLSARQWLRAAGDVPVVMYTAQNLDKRWPPPFAQYERAALDRVAAFYPCSTQAASVLRGKGFRGVLDVLPLGVDVVVHAAGQQALPAPELVLGLVGRLVGEKGVYDAVRVLAAVQRTTPARLLVVGEGPAAQGARRLSSRLGVADRCAWMRWCPPEELASRYRQMHVVLIPSHATTRWVEQFGRVAVEGSANGCVPVAYGSGSLPEVIGGCGVVLPASEPAAMAAAVVDLVQRPDVWMDLRSRGLAETSGHSWAAVAAAQLRLYETALRAPCRPARRPSAVTRRQAVAELGPPASAPGAAQRPFALPVLREGGPPAKVLARLVDAVTRQ